MELEKDLQRALKDNHFYIMYQPKWNVKTNNLAGFEALLCWRHPRLGIVSPAEFIPISEETVHIIPMTRWTLEQACKPMQNMAISGDRSNSFSQHFTPPFSYRYVS